MKRSILLLALVALIFPKASMAVDIELVPTNINVGIGEMVGIDVVVSGLGDLSAPSLGAFDVVLEYDDTLFAFQDVTFGLDLGDPNLIEALTTVTPMASQVQVIEASLLLPATLNGAQPDSFVLFTATFESVAVGPGVFDLAGGAILSDEVGSALALDNVFPATVTVNSGQSVVDVPTLSEWGLIALILCLMICGLASIRQGAGAGTALLLCVALLGTFGAVPVQAVDGDLEPDGDVDLNDVQAIYGALGNSVGAGDPMDLDDDGVITVLDVRLAVACCNLAGCAVIDNGAPTITALVDQTIDEDASTGALAFTVGDDNTASGALTVSAVSSDQTLIPNANLTLGGVGAARTINVTPVADANGGPVTITVTVDDGTFTTDEAFTVTVNAVNDPPSFTAGSDQAVAEDAGAQTVAAWATGVSAGPSDEAGQVLTFSVTNNTNPSLFAAGPAVDASGELTYTPAADANGSATITLELSDDGGGDDTSASQTFDITVTAVNDPPSFTAGADQTVLEDAGAQTVGAWATGLSAGPSDESGQTLSFSVTNNTDSSLFAAGPAIDSNGELTYTPAANANGSATITLELSDDGGGDDTSASQTFDITITPVNDVPTFTVGSDLFFDTDVDPLVQSIANFVTGISAGGVGEDGQTLTFTIVGNTDTSLFDVQPTIDSSGTLSFTFAFAALGTATITVELSDDGGTANGGVDTAMTQTFDIDVVSPR